MIGVFLILNFFIFLILIFLVAFISKGEIIFFVNVNNEEKEIRNIKKSKKNFFLFF